MNTAQTDPTVRIGFIEALYHWSCEMCRASILLLQLLLPMERAASTLQYVLIPFSVNTVVYNNWNKELVINDIAPHIHWETTPKAFCEQRSSQGRVLALLNIYAYLYMVIPILWVVAEWLACSPPTKAIRVQSPVGPLRIFGCGNRAGRCRWSAGFLGNLPFPLPFHSGTPLYSPRSPSSALKISRLRAVQISSLTPILSIALRTADSFSFLPTDGAARGRSLRSLSLPLPEAIVSRAASGNIRALPTAEGGPRLKDFRRPILPLFRRFPGSGRTKDKASEVTRYIQVDGDKGRETTVAANFMEVESSYGDEDREVTENAHVMVTRIAGLLHLQTWGRPHGLPGYIGDNKERQLRAGKKRIKDEEERKEESAGRGGEVGGGGRGVLNWHGFHVLAGMGPGRVPSSNCTAALGAGQATAAGDECERGEGEKKNRWRMDCAGDETAGAGCSPGPPRPATLALALWLFRSPCGTHVNCGPHNTTPAISNLWNTTPFCHVGSSQGTRQLCPSLLAADSWMLLRLSSMNYLLIIKARNTLLTACGVRGGVVVSLLSSHQGEQGSIPGEVALASSRMGVVPDDAAGRRASSGISRSPRSCMLAAPHTSPHPQRLSLASPPSAPKTSMLKGAQISSLTGSSQHATTTIPNAALGRSKTCSTLNNRLSHAPSSIFTLAAALPWARRCEGNSPTILTTTQCRVSGRHYPRRCRGVLFSSRNFAKLFSPRRSSLHSNRYCT
ncbi:hypothetical protein PR048_026712 [Dryococelus australis]|uniref:G-protein coupled receptors family 1 profile domain-containing protein n=1 Tax=Dryococelus australis TaxID=614101 RepID=A0ABQ9GM45_9NEOP|nr:hypothetical protein PR048_026712 [Dryococelus australis]